MREGDPIGLFSGEGGEHAGRILRLSREGVCVQVGNLDPVERESPLQITLVQAISAAGWFTPLADTNHVQVIRIVAGGKSVNAIISVDAITDNARADVKLQQGDTIKVDQRLF